MWSLATLAMLHALLASGAAAQFPHPSIAAGWKNTANTRSPLGTNLAGIADWSTEYPFVNRFKSARPWVPCNDEGWGKGKLAFDGNGNVLSLSGSQQACTLVNGDDPTLPGSRWQLYHDGQGTLSFNNVEVLQQKPGFANLRAQQGAMIICLTQTNKTNPLRNLRVLPPGGICTRNPLVAVSSASSCAKGTYRSFEENHDTIIFDPDFLRGIAKYRSIRFMDWGSTNNSPVATWTRRALPAHQFWSTEKGVPLEIMLALANLMNFTPWFCLPHLATDNYAQQFGKLLKAQLAPELKAYIEYSNEVWNGIFSQTEYAVAQGKQLKLHLPENDDYTGLCRFYSRRSQQIFDICAAQLGGSQRLIRVMATQAAVPYFTDVILAYGNASQKCDVFAIAPYFGMAVDNAGTAAELKQLGVKGIFSWLAGTPNGKLDYGSLPTVAAAVAEQVKAAGKRRKPLVAYEGGQHWVGVYGFENDDALNTLLDAVNRDAHMTQIYQQYLSNWKQATKGGAFHHFVHCDGWSKWGRWGAKEYQAQPLTKAPKLAALMSYIDRNPTA